MQRRITGFSVDFLIVATVAAIQLKIVWAYWLPISVLALVNAIFTTGLVVYFGRRLSSYSLERTAAIFGVVTGTVSCGLLLLRIVDPDFKTPVATEIAVMNVFALPVVGGCTVLVNGPLVVALAPVGSDTGFCRHYGHCLDSDEAAGAAQRRPGWRTGRAVSEMRVVAGPRPGGYMGLSWMSATKRSSAS